MKFNDDSLMLFDLDSCLDYQYDNIDNQFSNEYVDFTCNDLDPISKPCLINEIDLFSTTTTNEQDFTADFCDFTDSLFTYSLTNSTNSTMTSQNEASSSSINGQDKREVKKKLLDLTQRKLNGLCFDTKLRNQVLLKSALKSVNSINEDNLLGTKSKLELTRDKFDFKLNERNDKNENENDKFNNENNKYCNDFNNDKSIKDLKFDDDKEIKSRKRNFKSNLNGKDLIEEKNSIKKQKLSEFIDENSFNYNDELTLNNLANCFIKLKTQHTHD